MLAYPLDLLEAYTVTCAFWCALAPVEAYLAGFGLIMATGGFLWLAQGSAAVARAAGVMRRNDGVQHEGVVAKATRN